MRTKTLLIAAAALAVGLVTSQAQNVYSQNVVGYVNVPLVGGGSYNLIANPLNNANNNLTNLFPTASDGDSILTWNVAAFDFDGTIPAYSTFVNAWNANVLLKPGQGFFYVNNGGNRTNTFVGEVIQGSYSNYIAGSGSYNCLGSSAPLGGSFTNAIVGFTPADGDSVLKWDVAAFDFSGTIPAYSTFVNAWNTTALNIGVGEGFFYVRNGGNVNWLRDFTVN